MNIHFIAIGGSIMHNLALELHDKGYRITGSDDYFYEPSKSRLKSAGLLPKENGWFTDKIEDHLDAIILGMHAKKDNPELIKAQKMGLKIYSFPSYIYQETQHKKRISICGSHGKTTLTSMLLHILKHHNIGADYLVGAQIDGFKNMVSLKKEHTLAVFEGDEYLSSAIDAQSKFLHYQSHITLLTGIAWDHINIFKTFDDYLNCFIQLIKQKSNDDIIVYNTEDPTLKSCVEAHAVCRVIGYKNPESCNLKDNSIDYQNNTFTFSLFGMHNFNNMQGAVTLTNLLGIPKEKSYAYLSSFKGPSKRQEILLDTDAIQVYKDFAHAPSKVKATSQAFKDKFQDKTLIGCLELHTFSSLNKAFLPHYKASLSAFDYRYVFIDPKIVKNKKLDAISLLDIQDYFDDSELVLVHNNDDLSKHIIDKTRKNCVIVFMSSGSFSNLNFDELNQKIIHKLDL